MGKGLSPLQSSILAALREYPTYEGSLQGDHVSIKNWARPKDILAVLGIKAAPSTRAILSRALERLYRRGLVAKFHAAFAEAGNSARYALITSPENAGAGTRGPSFKWSRSTAKAQRPRGSMDADYTVTEAKHAQKCMDPTWLEMHRARKSSCFVRNRRLGPSS